MSRLSRESRELLAASRHVDRMSERDKARIRGKLIQRVGTSVSIGVAVGTGVSFAKAAHSSVLLSLAAWIPASPKLLGAIALIGAATVGAVVVSTPSQFTRSVARIPPQSSVARQTRQEFVVPQGASIAFARPTQVPQELESKTSSEAPMQDFRGAATLERKAPSVNAPGQTTRTGRSSTPALPTPPTRRSADQVGPTVESPAASALDVDGLRGQVLAIRASRDALRRGDASAALAALERGHPEGTHGALEQEALATRVSAYCLSNDLAQARRAANEFLRRFSDSLLTPGIRNSCAFEKTPRE